VARLVVQEDGQEQQLSVLPFRFGSQDYEVGGIQDYQVGNLDYPAWDIEG
jgi:hypothetical protein